MNLSAGYHLAHSLKWYLYTLKSPSCVSPPLHQKECRWVTGRKVVNRYIQSPSQMTNHLLSYKKGWLFVILTVDVATIYLIPKHYLLKSTLNNLLITYTEYRQDCTRFLSSFKGICLSQVRHLSVTSYSNQKEHLNSSNSLQHTTLITTSSMSPTGLKSKSFWMGRI